MWTRRALLKTGGIGLFSVSIGGIPLFLNQAVKAAKGVSQNRKTLITIFQRGGMDGLMAVAPFSDPMLPKLRPSLSMKVAPSFLIDLDGIFGLHPAFSSMEPLFQSKQLAIVHGVGSPYPTRSHFDAQDYMETGTPGRKGTTSGWLNRATGLLGHERSSFQAVSVTKILPLSLYGNQPALAIASLENFDILEKKRQKANNKVKVQQITDSYQMIYRDASQDLLRHAGNESFEAIEQLKSMGISDYRPANGASYPKSPLGRSLRQIAQLIKANVGLEIAFAESRGWDTHARQGTIEGSFARKGKDFSQSITALWTDLGDYQNDVVLMTMTEFGRTVSENGSGGTDHGRASCLFVLGTQVDGGKVHGNVPHLVPEALDRRRDLPVTTDFRSVFSNVAGTHLDISDDQALFPDWTGERLPLLKA